MKGGGGGGGRGRLGGAGKADRVRFSFPLSCVGDSNYLFRLTTVLSRPRATYVASHTPMQLHSTRKRSTAFLEQSTRFTDLKR